MVTICRTRTIAAEAREVWDLLANFGEISSWATNVDHSCLLQHGPDGDLIGTSRRIQIGRQTFVERITRCTPHSSLEYDIEGLPRWLRSVHAGWQLLPTGSRTQIALASTVELGSRPLQQLAAQAICRAMAAKSEIILAGLAKRMERASD